MDNFIYLVVFIIAFVLLRGIILKNEKSKMMYGIMFVLFISLWGIAAAVILNLIQVQPLNLIVCVIVEIIILMYFANLKPIKG